MTDLSTIFFKRKIDGLRDLLYSPTSCTHFAYKVSHSGRPLGLEKSLRSYAVRTCGAEIK